MNGQGEAQFSLQCIRSPFHCFGPPTPSDHTRRWQLLHTEDVIWHDCTGPRDRAGAVREAFPEEGV